MHIVLIPLFLTLFQTGAYLNRLLGTTELINNARGFP
jgi:hypothetical protein